MLQRHSNYENKTIPDYKKTTNKQMIDRKLKNTKCCPICKIPSHVANILNSYKIILNSQTHVKCYHIIHHIKYYKIIKQHKKYAKSLKSNSIVLITVMFFYNFVVFVMFFLHLL